MSRQAPGMVDLRTGDCLAVMRDLEPESVQCVVTSPPYWGLRDYGTAGQLGLEPTPEEYVANLVAVFREVRRVLRPDGTVWLNLGDSYAGPKGNTAMTGGKTDPERGRAMYGDIGASQKVPFGLKPKDLVGIPWRVAFALQQPYHAGPVKRLEDRMWLAGLTDGEGCLTILQTTSSHGSGNSYPPVFQIRMCDIGPIERCAHITGYGNASPKQEPPSQGGQRASYQWRLNGRKAADVAAEVYPFLYVKRKQAIVLWNHQAVRDSYETKRGQKMPPAAAGKQQACRDLVQRLNAHEDVDLPSWMVEPPLLEEPGWYLRSDCIWHKPNPMPESVTDRPTKAHEYLFLLSKRATYYYDATAVAEASVDPESINGRRSLRNDYSLGKIDPDGHGATRTGFKDIPLGKTYPTRNRRTVWTIATKPYRGAHFAVMPPALVEPCILAGTSERGCCPVCGAPWERVVERHRPVMGVDVPVANCRNAPGSGADRRGKTSSALLVSGSENYTSWRAEHPDITTGWRPTCAHDADPVPCTVLDPFTGSGTVGAVAVEHGRRFVGIELNPAYVELARERILGEGLQIRLQGMAQPVSRQASATVAMDPATDEPGMAERHYQDGRRGGVEVGIR